jgi:Fe-S-cluster containining protein
VNPQGEGFVCAFLDCVSNKCKIYAYRPFECQLYPFLINLRREKVVLTIDLNCPYAKEKINSVEFKEYSEYLSAYLNSPEQLEILRDNPQIIQAYEDVLDVVELNLPDAPK